MFHNMFSIILALSLKLFLFFSDAEEFVEQHVDTISIVHLRDDVNFIFFFDMVQGEWSLLDHRWQPYDVSYVQRDGKFGIFWRDDQDSCWRLITTNHWCESWEIESPLSEQNNRPWFARLLACGLKKPPEKKEK